MVAAGASWSAGGTGVQRGGRWLRAALGGINILVSGWAASTLLQADHDGGLRLKRYGTGSSFFLYLANEAPFRVTLAA